MKIKIALLMCLWTTCVYAQLQQEVQQCVPPVAIETEGAAKNTTEEDGPQKNLSCGPTSMRNETQSDKAQQPQGCTNTESNKWTDPITIFTFFLTGFTALTWWTYYGILTSTKAIERAYIKISSIRDRFAVRPKEEGGECLVTIQIRNSGNTPARVIRKFLACRLYPRDQDPPHEPHYGDDGTMEAFLVKGDFFYTSRSFSLSMEELTSVIGKEPTMTLYLIGYVDYIDKFEVFHRAGFARQYDPASGSLAFTNASGYNYDREYKEKGLH